MSKPRQNWFVDDQFILELCVLIPAVGRPMDTIPEVKELASSNDSPSSRYSPLIPDNTNISNNHTAGGKFPAYAEERDNTDDIVPSPQDAGQPETTTSYGIVDDLAIRTSGNTFKKASVEDCPDEEDSPLNQDATPPSTDCATPVPIHEASPEHHERMGDVSGASDSMQPKEDKNEEPSHQTTRQRRMTPVEQEDESPHVMKYLVSEAPPSEQANLFTTNISGQYPSPYLFKLSSADHYTGRAAPKDQQDRAFDSSSNVNPSGCPADGWSQTHLPFQNFDKAQSLVGNLTTEGAAHAYLHPTHFYPVSPFPAQAAASTVQPAPYTPHQSSIDMPGAANRVVPSGYHFLAAKIAGEAGGHPVAPIYRRFQALHHRLLLYIQDELDELERKVYALEATDSFERSRGGTILPASRRQSRWASGGHGVSAQLTEILGQVGYKLAQYSKKSLGLRPARFYIH